MANMFGALNRFISRLDSESQTQQASSRSTQGYGFQVLRNNDHSLALEPWFDFIIGINGRNIDNADPQLFATEVRNCAGATISLGIYSAKGQQIREMYVAVPREQPSLGLSLQWCPLNVTEDVWHILDVMPNSPADVAGLLPYSDYVIGSPDGNLRGDAGLGALVEQYIDRPLRFYVYNHEYDVTRLVTITPSKTWGGDGALGCVLGYGALHRVPAPLTEPSQGPGETLFDGNDQQQTYQPQDPSQEGKVPQRVGQIDSEGFFVPADWSSAPKEYVNRENIQHPGKTEDGGNAYAPPPAAPAAAPPPPTGRAKKARAHHATPAAGLDEYFAEGEKKSREMDNAPTPKPTGGLPPPSKGGPPKAASPAPAPESEEAAE